MSESTQNESTPNESTQNESTYVARLVGSDGTETIELDLIGGLPRKSIIRDAAGESGEDEVVWELVTDSTENDSSDGGDSDGFEYREAGRPGADYS